MNFLSWLTLLYIANQATCYMETLKELYINHREPLLNLSSASKLHFVDLTGSIGRNTVFFLTALKELSITHSRIDYLDDYALCLPSKLRVLFIEDNVEFPIITGSVLGFCQRLHFISLKGVEIRPDAFRSLVSVKWIKLQDLQDLHWTKEYFRHLKSLQGIQLYNSKIRKFDDNSICLSSKLEYIDMKENCIIAPLTKSTFENCKTVNKLTLLDNLLSIEEGVFSGFVNVSNAFLNHVNVYHLTKEYLVGLNNVEILWWEHSYITIIDPDAFVGLRKLEILSLNGNRLTTLSTDVIFPLQNLERLFLNGNSLITIDNIHHPNLNTLYLASNNILEIDGKLVRGNMPNLRVMNVDNNQLSPENRYYIKQFFCAQLEASNTTKSGH